MSKRKMTHDEHDDDDAEDEESMFGQTQLINFGSTVSAEFHGQLDIVVNRDGSVSVKRARMRIPITKVDNDTLDANQLSRGTHLVVSVNGDSIRREPAHEEDLVKAIKREDPNAFAKGVSDFYGYRSQHNSKVMAGGALVTSLGSIFTLRKGARADYFSHLAALAGALEMAYVAPSRWWLARDAGTHAPCDNYTWPAQIAAMSIAAHDYGLFRCIIERDESNAFDWRLPPSSGWLGPRPTARSWARSLISSRLPADEIRYVNQDECDALKMLLWVTGKKQVPLDRRYMANFLLESVGCKLLMFVRK
jgi:hypothetical protein